MATHSTTRSATKAKVLTAITVAAAGVAAYAVGTLSNDLVSQPNSVGTFTQAELRRSCLLTCEYNGGFPCGASLDAVAEAACNERVAQCQFSCPAPDLNTVMLQAGAVVEAIPRGMVGQNYYKKLEIRSLETAVGGTWEITAGALPPGMNIDPTNGLLYGAPSRAETYRFSVTRRVPTGDAKASEAKVTANLELVVENAAVPISPAGTGAAATGGFALSPLDITTPLGSLRATREQEFSLPLAVYGISPGKQIWSVSYGRLPDGMRLDPAGRLYGKPTEKAGLFRFGVSVTSDEHRASGLYAYEDAMLEVVDAAASAGSGVVTGSVGDAAGGSNTGSGATALTAAEKADLEANTVMLPTVLPVAKVGELYSVPLSTNDTIARSWSAAGLPDGLTFNPSTRVISGTPTKDGTFTLVVTASRSADVPFVKQYALTVNRASTVVTGSGGTTAADTSKDIPGIVIDTAVPNGVAGEAYRAQLRAMSSYAAYRWSFASGFTAPSNWKLSTDGVLSNTQPTAGVVTLRVTVRDGGTAGAAATSDIVVNIRERATTTGSTSGSNTNTNTNTTTGSNTSAASPLSFADVGAYPDGTVNAYYNARPFEVSGGRAPYSYAVTVGTLPNGLTTTTNGSIQGTPTRAGTYNFTMRVRDALGETITANRTIRIAAAPVVSSGSSSGGSSGGGFTVVMPPTPNSEDAATQARLNTLNRLGIRVHDLVKLQDDGDESTQHDTTVYYIGSDGRRHFFPNAKVFFTWFVDFGGVRIVSSSALAEIPLGANVTYRPGVRMVKFESDNKVYVVESGRRLRWIQSETDATTVYGPGWNRNIDDVPVTFYTDYVFGTPVSSAALVSPSQLMTSVIWPSQVLP